MQTSIKKWGNSLGIRLPINLAKELNLSEDSLVDIEEHNGKIILSPIKENLTLEKLIEGMTLEGAIDQFHDYPAIGKEVEI